MLGPVLFLIFINADIGNTLSSSIRLFADVMKVYRVLNCWDFDTMLFQQDLDKLEEWSNDWQMKFICDKCGVMRISHSKDESIPQYNLLNQPLRVVSDTKDLGEHFTSNLLWSL